jgi:hypothetical protein
MAKGIRNVWETNFVHDLMSLLYELEARGKGSSNVSFILLTEPCTPTARKFPPAAKKAHRHAAGTHVHAVDGEGYSLLWYEGDSELRNSRGGTVHVHAAVLDVSTSISTPVTSRAPPRLQSGQPALSFHFALAQELRRRRLGVGAAGWRQIEYEDQDPRIHRQWLDAIRANGVESQMGDVFDEPRIPRCRVRP